MRIAVRSQPQQEVQWFAEGVRACGDEVVAYDIVRGPPQNVRQVAVWGWRRGMQFRQRGHEVLVLERAYIGDRFFWTSVGWNGLNNRARFYYEDDAGARWREHFAQLMQPWRERDDGYALLIGQVPTDTAVMRIRMDRWLQQTANFLRRSGEQVLFRPHPNAPNARVTGAEISQGTLADDFAGASRVVTFNSNAGVESVLAGIPTYAEDAGSMAYDMATHQLLESPIRPDRTQWAHRMAWTQWQPEELKSGAVWARIRTMREAYRQ